MKLKNRNYGGRTKLEKKWKGEYNLQPKETNENQQQKNNKVKKQKLWWRKVKQTEGMIKWPLGGKKVDGVINKCRTFKGQRLLRILNVKQLYLIVSYCGLRDL